MTSQLQDSCIFQAPPLGHSVILVLVLHVRLVAVEAVDRMLPDFQLVSVVVPPAGGC